jgi:outer membrane cobalamin receptor
MGLEHAFPGDRITVSVTYFDQRFSDLIEYSPSAAPNYFNVVGARVGGVEARLSAALARGVTASMSYGYLDTRVLEGGVDGGPDGLFLAGRPLIRRPGHTFAPEVWASLGGRGHVTVTGRWVGARDDLDFSRDVDSRRVRLRPYARFSIAAEYQVTRGGPTGAAFVLTARIDNVTGDDAQEIAGFRPRGRSVLVGGRLVLGR